MDNMFSTTGSLETRDEDIRFRPASGIDEPFQMHQPSLGSLGAQPSFALDYDPNFLDAAFEYGESRDLQMDDLGNIMPFQRREVDAMLQWPVMQQQLQPTFSSQLVPHSHHFTDHGIGQTPSFNFGPEHQRSRIEFQATPQILQPVGDSISGNALYASSSTHQLPTHIHPHQSGTMQPPSRKRAPKAPTMSPKKWAPAEDRIRQLFLDGKSTYKDLTDTVNKEFGFTATERQYKAKILQMKLKRNVESKDRATVVRHVRYRKDTCNKVTNYVRICGHRKPEAMIQQWMKDFTMIGRSKTFRTPSPLPSHAKTHKMTESEFAGMTTVTPLTRLLDHVPDLDTVMGEERSADLFNDIQQILSSGHINPVREESYRWDPAIQEDIVTVRNWMNLLREVGVKKESQGSTQSLQALTRNRKLLRVGVLETEFATVHYNLHRTSDSSDHTVVDQRGVVERSTAAQIAISPTGIASRGFRILFDLDPRLSPSATITYQATRPFGSEIFGIVKDGKLEDLLKALEAKTASLTDRDEEGRSLLNYAKTYERPEICRFLLDKGFEPDALELDWSGLAIPISWMFSGILTDFSESEPREYTKHQIEISECYKLMLEAGADFGECHGGVDDFSGFRQVLQSESLSTLEHVIRHGQPFVNTTTLVQTMDGLGSPLLLLSEYSGNDFCEPMYILEKTVALLKWGVEVSCRSENGDTVLHTVLKCRRKSWSNRRINQEPGGELLKVFISAGADIYALNNFGESPSRIAKSSSRRKEWMNALKFCGFDAKEIVRQTLPRRLYTGPRQTTTLSFDEYYQEWERKGMAEWRGRCGCVGIEEEAQEVSEDEYGSEWWCDSDVEEDIDEEDGIEDEECSEEPIMSGDLDLNIGDSSDSNDLDDRSTGRYHYSMSEEPATAGDEALSVEFNDNQPTFIQMNHSLNTPPRAHVDSAYDPMLYEQTSSVSGSWGHARALDPTRSPSLTAVTGEEYFAGLEGVFDNDIQTAFDDFMQFDPNDL